MEQFNQANLKELFKPENDSHGEDNGQVTIIGGSTLFHGAPIFALKTASRIVDMVFFATPEKSIGRVAEMAKSKLNSFIWIPWEETEKYIEKSSAVLIGPGFMRFGSEKTPDGQRHTECDEACVLTREITEKFLKAFPDKKWVIDAGSLQTMDADWIPVNSILTPNRHEFMYLFGDMEAQEASRKYNCVIVKKGPVTEVYSKDKIYEIGGGNAGLTKGGTGDTLAGLTVALLAKNDPLLSACAASLIVKKTAEELHRKVGVNFNTDDLVEKIPEVFSELQK